jgi:hypothetical protein
MVIPGVVVNRVVLGIVGVVVNKAKDQLGALALPKVTGVENLMVDNSLSPSLSPTNPSKKCLSLKFSISSVIFRKRFAL